MPHFAGVLPYAHDAAGEVHLLLGREHWGKEAGAWSGFAGKCEACDGGDALRTAAREAFEESCGMLGSLEDLCNILAARAGVFRAATGTHYLLPFQLNAYLPVMFQGVQAAIRTAAGGAANRFLEKDAVAWYSLAGLRNGECGILLRGGFRADLDDLARAILPATRASP